MSKTTHRRQELCPECKRNLKYKSAKRCQDCATKAKQEEQDDPWWKVDA